MGRFDFFGEAIPELDLRQLKGKLIVIEGADGVGRSTQIELLKQWLEIEGHAVLVTRTSRSALAGKKLRRARKGTTFGRVTMALFYATDFADRVEHKIIPALKAGFIVLADRYIYTLVGRALARGIDPEWIREVYSFALQPDKIFYLRASVDDLVSRVLQKEGFDYWESGMDLHLGDDLFESFVEYQNRMIGQFDKMVEDYGFKVIDASHPIDEVFANLKAQVSEVLTPARPLLSDSLERLKQFRNGYTTQDSLQAESLNNTLLDGNGGPSGEPIFEPRRDEIRPLLRR